MLKYNRMNAKTFTLDFIDDNTGLPLTTVRGDVAIWFAQNSALIREIIEIDPGKQGYTIHVSLPTDRALILRKILRGEPVGVKDWNSDYVEFYPLGPLEEKDIKAAVGNSKVELNRERARVIQQVLQYLIVDPDVEGEVVLAEYPKRTNEQQERVRRSNITHRRKYSNIPQQRGLPFLNENTIEKYVEGHKNYLYKKYLQHPDRKAVLQKFMSKQNVENRNARRTRNVAQRFRNYGLASRGPLNSLQIPPELGINKNYPRMTSRNFERFIRSKRGKAERNLPYQGNFRLANLFGDNE